jgi:hypothetical protein
MFVSLLTSYQIFLSATLVCSSTITTSSHANTWTFPSRSCRISLALTTSPEAGTIGLTSRMSSGRGCAKLRGFLDDMSVGAPIGVTRFYYFAVWVGLAVSAVGDWVLCKISPPPSMYTRGWKESKDYIRPEEDLEIIEGLVGIGGEVFSEVQLTGKSAGVVVEIKRY